MTELRIRPVIRTDLAKHPAVRAWNDLGRSGALPEAVEVLKEARAKPDSRAVYRLAGVGPRGASVVAKRCGWDDAVHERTLYEQIIPRLPVSTVRYYGFVPDPTGRVAWLFLEDAGDDPYSPRLPAHRELAAKWLGFMHTRAAGVAGAMPLPERGLGWFRNRLRSARELLAEALNGSAVDGSEALKLDRLLRWCKATEERWPEIIASCDGMPSTLVHADFVGENVRVRNDDAGLTLLPFDWGTSGWGLPARDLVGVDIAVYHSIVQDYWPAMGEEDLRRLAAVGKLFRLIGAIHRACMSLPYAPVQKVLSDMRFLAVRA